MPVGVGVMRLVVSSLVMSLLPSAWGFGISPCLRKLTFIEGEFRQEKMSGASLSNQCNGLTLDFKSAVHEHMALAAIAQFRGEEHLVSSRHRYTSVYMIEKPWVSRYGLSHETRGIIFGVWWNDDPLRRTCGQRDDFAGGALKAIGSTMFKADSYAAAGDCTVSGDQHLGNQSHFGKL